MRVILQDIAVLSVSLTYPRDKEYIKDKLPQKIYIEIFHTI